MERLVEDMEKVTKLLPWIESPEDVVNFMRRVPLDQSHLRCQLAVLHFIKQQDESDDFQNEIENDAKDILVLIPDIPYKEIKERLSILGNIPNRKEVVTRQFLRSRNELNTVLEEINVQVLKKRKSELVGEEDSNDGETNIRSKLRRTAGVKFEMIVDPRPSTSKEVESTPQPSTSFASVSTTVHDSNSNSPGSNFLSAAIDLSLRKEIDDYLEDFVATAPEPPVSQSNEELNMNEIGLCSKKMHNEIIDLVSSPSRSENVIHSPRISCSIHQNQPKQEDDASDSTEDFDLINFLRELSSAPYCQVVRLCERMNLNLNKRPREEVLTNLLNKLLDGYSDIESSQSNSSSQTSLESTEESLTLPGPSLQKQKVTASRIPHRQFALRPSLLKPHLEQHPIERNSVQSSLKSSIIQPARFDPQKTVTNAFPPNNTCFRNKKKKMTELPPIEILEDTTCEGIVKEPEVAAGPSDIPIVEKRQDFDNKLVLKLIELFPETCPDFIRDLCRGKKWEALDDVITEILSVPDCPKRPERVPSPQADLDPEEQYAIIKELLPNADPNYIRINCERYANDEAGLKEFVNHAMEFHDYPTMKEYLRKQQLSAQQKQYTVNFNVENFVSLFPDPNKTFSDPKRISNYDYTSMHYLNIFFRNRYDRIQLRTITNVLEQCKNKTLEADKQFTAIVRKNQLMKTRRKPVPLPNNFQNIPLLQELAYLSHKEEIESYVLEKKKMEIQERKDAKENGLMESCQCCYDDEVMPKDTFMCPNECKFCRDCIQKSCEVKMGEGKVDFPCLNGCDYEFSLQTLQQVLPPKMFSKLAQKKALAEIKAAGIEELEMCPFCDFASIPNEADKIFRCLNPDCMKESCRQCKEPNHVPLKCEEVEKDAEVKARTYIEDKMTEALVRKCWKCGTRFFKEEGCNKMTCSCGAMMCYICKQPVLDYSHFNGIGGDKFDRCPLYSDSNLLNQQNVLQAAKDAKAEVDPSTLKHDPTQGIQEHYTKRAKKLPKEPHLEVLERAANMHLHHIHHHFHHHQAALQDLHRRRHFRE